MVSDTVFSMDGDAADVEALLDLCAQEHALLVLDEAHAVLGPELTDPGPAVLRIGTLSKTLGALGGFVAGPRALTELVINRARSYIFTTATSPPDAAAALAALRVVRSSEGDALRAARPGYGWLSEETDDDPARLGHETLFIVEAMKTMNPIPAPRGGTVKEICVENGAPVEFGQTLLILG